MRADLEDARPLLTDKQQIEIESELLDAISP